MYSDPPDALLLVVDAQPQLVPFVDGCIRAGFPSPADDFAVKELDLVALLVKRPLATFFWQVAGKSMQDAGIGDGDIIVVDRSMRPQHGQIVVAVVDGDFTVKYLHKLRGLVKLVPANPEFEDIVFVEGQELVVCGVVTGCIKRFC